MPPPGSGGFLTQAEVPGDVRRPMLAWDAITGDSAGSSFTGRHGRGARSRSRFLGAQLVGGLGAAIIWAMVRPAFMLAS
jgi:hypothetical protein